MNGMWRVELVRIGAVPPSRLRTLRRDLARALAHPVGIAPDSVDPAPAYAPDRRQYLVTSLLAALLERPRNEGVYTIGVARIDLFLPVFTHVFGMAQIGGPVGVASEFRLHPEPSEEALGADLLRRRLLVEVLHELGHTLGLVHCKTPWCAMSPSRLPEQVDLKDPAYCRSCAEATGVPETNSFVLFSSEGEPK